MNRAKISDQELIDLYLAGNEACLETLIKRHKSKVYTTIYHIVLDRYMADTAGNDILSYIQLADESREDVMMRKESERTVRELVKLLPEEQREVLLMRHYGDMSFKEIADTTGVSINTALGRMRYALE
jgi:RNA polymerase sigma factor (sigma-70 family)